MSPAIASRSQAEQTPAPAILRAEGLSKRFGARLAVAALTCEVRSGEVVGLIGPNGAGKTTTMRLALGLLLPSEGRIEVLGVDCASDSVRVKELIGYVPDEPAFYDFLSGRETIDFACEMRGLERRAAWERLAPFVAKLDLAPELDRLVAGYSHGTKKKLALLLALVHGPPLLLLDEPTNGLDPPSANLVRRLLSELAGAGAGILLSTHLLDMADRLCHRLVFLDHGRLVAGGTPAELRALAGLGSDASLEDAFLRLVARPE